MLNTMNFYPWNDIFWLILMLIILWITCWNVESVAICTKTFVQHFVENLLKVLKVLKKQIKADRRPRARSHVMLFVRRTAPSAWPSMQNSSNLFLKVLTFFKNYGTIKLQKGSEYRVTLLRSTKTWRERKNNHNRKVCSGTKRSQSKNKNIRRKTPRPIYAIQGGTCRNLFYRKRKKSLTRGLTNRQLHKIMRYRDENNQSSEHQGHDRARGSWLLRYQKI